MTLEERLKTYHNSGIIEARGSGHSTQPKLIEMTEDWWLGAAIARTSAGKGRLALKGDPIAGIAISMAFPEIPDVSRDSDNKYDYTTEDDGKWALIEPIQKGTEYVVTIKTNTAALDGAELQGDGGYFVPTAIGVAQICTIQTVADVGGNLNDTYFLINSIDANGDQIEYYVWFNINSAGTDPDLDGKIGIEIAAATAATADTLATAIGTALDLKEFSTSVVTDTVTCTNTYKGECQNPVDSQQSPTGFTIATTTEGSEPTGVTTPTTAIGGINKLPITATGATEKLTIMEGR